MKWIKASEGIPEPPFTARIIGTKISVSYEDVILKNKNRDKGFIRLIEILDESHPEQGEQWWKEKFEYWLTNNQYINKITAINIINHAERYVAPSPPPEGQDADWAYILKLEKQVEALTKELEEKNKGYHISNHGYNPNG